MTDRGVQLELPAMDERAQLRAAVAELIRRHGRKAVAEVLGMNDSALGHWVKGELRYKLDVYALFPLLDMEGGESVLDVFLARRGKVAVDAVPAAPEDELQAYAEVAKEELPARFLGDFKRTVRARAQQLATERAARRAR